MNDNWGIHKIFWHLYFQKVAGQLKIYTASKKHAPNSILVLALYWSRHEIGLFPPQKVNALSVFKHRIILRVR